MKLQACEIPFASRADFAQQFPPSPRQPNSTALGLLHSDLDFLAAYSPHTSLIIAVAFLPFYSQEKTPYSPSSIFRGHTSQGVPDASQTIALRNSLTSVRVARGDALRVRRIVIVDAHSSVREGLRRIIQEDPDFTVCAEAGSARGARIALENSQPDLLIADLNLSDCHGFGLVKELRAQYPDLPILMLSSYDEHLFAERLISMGANGYLMKESPIEEIVVALRQVLAGRTYLSHGMRDAIVEKFTLGAAGKVVDPIDRLSNRELQVLHLIGKGLSTREAAHSLQVGIKTIESHRQRIKHRLNLQTGTQLVQFAVQWFIAAESGREQPGRAERPRYAAVADTSGRIVEVF